MSSPKTLFGFHAIGVRLKVAPESVIEIHFESSRRDARMRSFIDRAAEAKVRLIEADGLQFFTNLGSRKAANLTANARAAAVFHWKSLQRQVVVEGAVSRVSDEVADAYFATRARGSQLGAWASAQGSPLDDRSTLDARLAIETERFRDGPVPRPPFWSGFRIDPVRFEFWQGRSDRLHDRVEFRSHGSSWSRGLLFP